METASIILKTGGGEQKRKTERDTERKKELIKERKVKNTKIL